MKRMQKVPIKKFNLIPNFEEYIYNTYVCMYVVRGSEAPDLDPVYISVPSAFCGK